MSAVAMKMAPDCPTRELLGLRIHALTMQQTLARIEMAIDQREPLLIAVVNAAKVVNLRKDAELRESVLTADLTLADGMAVVWASRVLGRPLPERVAGIDLMTEMLALADRRSYGVYLLGAAQDILDEVVRVIRERYPRARLVGARDGYFTPQQEADIAAEIGAARPDMLFVAITSPKKERFLARWSEHMNVPVCHGVGGSFDVMAGKVKRAPRLWQRLGMEWLYRVLQEPGRLWRRYLVTNVAFLWLVVRELLSGGSRVHSEG